MKITLTPPSEPVDAQVQPKKPNFFDISEKPNKRLFVVDDFYSDPLAVRNFAFSQEYIQGGIGKGFIGTRTKNQFLFPGLKEKFEDIMGVKIREWESHGMNGRFQYCIAGEPLVYHCDDQTWAAMLFLTPDAPFECGTSFFAHKKTRARHSSDPKMMEAFATGTHLDKTPYQAVDVIGNVYNRVVIFDAHLLHSASEYFGSNMNNGRLFHIFFFD
jgi:hypothetical protein